MPEQAVELHYGGAWHDVTADFRGPEADSGGGISLQRGRRSQGTAPDPGVCSLVVNNATSWINDSVSGRYSPRNPNSDLFGLIGRNTPLRVHLGTPPVAAANGSTSAVDHVAPSVTATAAGLLICGWLANEPLTGESYTPPGGMDEQAQEGGTFQDLMVATETVTAGATGTRTATYDSFAATHVTASVVMHGAAVAVEEVLSDAATDSGDLGVAPPDLTLTTDAGTQAGWWLVAVQGWRRDGDPVPWDDEGEWTLLADSGADDGTAAVSNKKRIRVWARQLVAGGAQTVTFPSFPLGSGFETFSASNQAVLLVLSGVDDWSIRAAVEVAAWPPRRDVSDRDRWVPIEGSGILRRLGTGQRALRSPLYRDITTDTRAPLDSYWPLEADRGSGVAGGQAARTFGSPQFSADAGPAGSAGALILDDSTQVVFGRCSNVAGLVAAAGNSVWVLDWWMTPAATSTPARMVVNVGGTGSASAIAVDLTATGWELEIATTGSFSVVDSGSADLAGSHSFALDVRQSAGNVLTTLYVDGVAVGQDSTAGTLNYPSDWQAQNLDSNVEVAIAHVAVWNAGGVGASLNAGSILAPRVAGAGAAWAGETAGRRIERLCLEEGIQFRNVGDLDDSPPMGVQVPATMLDLLRHAAQVDGGILAEARAAVGLLYRPLRGLYDRAATATLDYAGGEVAPPLEPMPDDQLSINRAVMSRPGGGSAIVERTDGPKGTDTVGVYEESAEVQVMSDLDLPNQGAWRVHLGTVDEDRIPTISINLANPAVAGDAALVAAIRALAEGDVIEITNPPDDLPPETIRQVVQGVSETIDQFVHTITLNTTPGGPYTVGQRSSGSPGPADPVRRDTAGSILDAEFEAGTDTTMDVETTAGPLWAQTGAANIDLPFDVKVAGCRIRVTAIGAPTGQVQTFTVSATVVNGVTKTIPAGTAVSLWQPAVRAL